MLTHVLGADIQHHNLTVLHFFNDQLAKQLPVNVATDFMVVGEATKYLTHFPELNVTFYKSKKALVKALLIKAQANQNQRFFFHGQFNVWIWLALLRKKRWAKRCYWHIWGADLYEESQQLKFRLWYPLRRLAQARVAKIFATQGDLNHYQQRHASVPTALLYFPTRMLALSEATTLPRVATKPLTILVGNSGDRSNRHIEALKLIASQFGQAIKLVIPMGYPTNNQNYIDDVTNEVTRLFPEQSNAIITENLTFTDYLALLQQCDLGYFMFARQQGIGTLCLLLQQRTPFVLNQRNPFIQDLQQQHIPFLLANDQSLSVEQVAKVTQQLKKIDLTKIPFFPPNYIDNWLTELNKIGENRE